MYAVYVRVIAFVFFKRAGRLTFYSRIAEIQVTWDITSSGLVVADVSEAFILNIQGPSGPRIVPLKCFQLYQSTRRVPG